jgi:NADH dehydrogenase
VLLGCSFAGLEFLYHYARRRGRFADGEVLVVDPRPVHEYVPLLHEQLAGSGHRRAPTFDACAFCRAVGAEFRRAAAVGVDPSAQVVTLDDGGVVRYATLVIAVGSAPAVPAVLSRAPSVVGSKSLEDVARLRAAVAAHPGVRDGRVPVVVVGGGLTGVEWAAELAGSPVGGRAVAVTLVDAVPRVLPTFGDGVAAHATRVLRGLGVELLLGRTVQDVDGEGTVALDDGRRLPAGAVLWAGGVRPSPALGAFGLPLGARGHLLVTPRLDVRGADGRPMQSLHAIGDAVRVVGDDGVEWPTMVRAIEAIWQGKLLARRLAGRHAPGAGPRHRLRRDFFHGVSLGPGHSLVVYGRRWADARPFVGLRRLLMWGYYVRYRLLGAVLGVGAGRAARVR